VKLLFDQNISRGFIAIQAGKPDPKKVNQYAAGQSCGLSSGCSNP
jgi:hypothetical protein